MGRRLYQPFGSKTILPFKLEWTLPQYFIEISWVISEIRVYEYNTWFSLYYLDKDIVVEADQSSTINYLNEDKDKWALQKNITFFYNLHYLLHKEKKPAKCELDSCIESSFIDLS